MFLSILYGNVRLYYDYTNVKNELIPEPDEKLEIVFDIDEYGTVIIPIMQEDCLLYNIALRWSIPKTLCDEQKRPSELSEQVVGKKFIHLKEERFRKCSPSLQYISYLYFNRKNIILIDLSRNRPPKPVTKELHHKSRAACRPCVHTIKRLKYPVNIHRSAI